MPFYLKYICTIIINIPWFHWAAIGVLSLTSAVIVSIYKKGLLYSAIILGITTFIVLFILEMAVVVRYCGIMPHGYGYDFSLGFNRLLYGGEPGRREILSNIVVFVPYGIVFSEFISSTRQFRVRRQIGYITLFAFGISLCIECLQWILRVGYFELADLVMNTVGAVIGVCLALIGRRVFTVETKFSPHCEQS